MRRHLKNDVGDLSGLRVAIVGDVNTKDVVAKMKKYLNFVGQSVDPAGAFLRDMRSAQSEAALFAACDRHLLAEPARLFSPEPYPGVIARPNCETSAANAPICSL